jgi:RND family efflux transporter MFP subunit
MTGEMNRLLKMTCIAAVSTALLLVFPLAGCKKKPPPMVPPPPKVTVMQPIKKVVDDYLELTGNTQAVNTVQLRARVEGVLEKVFFKDGQMVKKDQPLFRIQQNTYKARIRQAEGQILLQKSQRDYAQSELTRYTSLFQHKAASQTDIDNWRNQHDSAQANLQTAEAQRDLARLDLGYTDVFAPFDGRIDRRLQDPGNLVGSGGSTVLAELVQIDPIYVYFTINDKELGRLMESTKGLPGMGKGRKRAIEVGLVNETGYPHKGWIDFTSTSLSPTSGTLLLRGILPNREGKILPGLYARVRVSVKKESAFLIPQEAVGYDQQGPYVLVATPKNLVQRVGIQSDILLDHFRVIKKGLAGNEWVIIKGIQKAFPGRMVTPERSELPPPNQATDPSSLPRQKAGS